MKKIMLFLIAVIPLILIFTIQITTNTVRTVTYISVEKVAFESNYKTIYKTDDNPVVLDFAARITPEAATNKDVKYFTSDSDIATVDKNGLIIFRDFGDVIITVESALTNSIKDSCRFLVTDDKAHRVVFANAADKLKLTKGDIFYLETKIIPNESLNKNLVFSTSDENVVKVSADGRLVAVDGGSAVITATTNNGKTCSVRVDVFVPVQSIDIGGVANNISTAKNTVQFPAINILPKNATNKNIIYSSKDSSIGEIDNLGHITLKKSGVVTFVATSENGNYQVSYTINYTGGYVTEAIMSQEFLDKIIEMPFVQDKTFSIDYLAYPIDYRQSHIKNVWWESDNNNVIQVVGESFVIKGGGTVDLILNAQIGEGLISRSKTTIKVLRSAATINIFDVGNAELNDDPNDGVIITNSLTTKINYQTLSAQGTEDCTDVVSILPEEGQVKQQDKNSFVLELAEAKAQSVAITISTDNISESIILQYIVPTAININVVANTEIQLESDTDYVFWLDDLSYEWSGFDNRLIVKNDDGSYRAQSSGKTTLTTSVDGQPVSFGVEVIKAAQDIFVNGVAIAEKYETSQSTWQIVASVYPTDATEQAISFESKTPAVATVSSTGLISFSSAGIVKIVAKVKAHPLKDIYITKNIFVESTLGKPKDFQFTTSSTIVVEDIGAKAEVVIADNFLPADYTLNVDDVTFISGNNAIATVSKEIRDGKVYGVITGIDGGNTTISAIIGSVQRSVNVVVNVVSKSLSVKYLVDGEYKEWPVMAGVYNYVVQETLQIKVDVYPENTTQKDVVFAAIDGIKVSVLDSGLITFEEMGLVRIRIIAVDSGIWVDIVVGRTIPDIIVYQDTNVSNKKIIVNRTDANPNLRAVLDFEVEDRYLLDGADITDVVVENNCNLTIQSDNEGLYTIVKPDTMQRTLDVRVVFMYFGKTTFVDITFLALDKIEIAQLINDRVSILDNNTDADYGYEQKRVFGSTSYMFASPDSTERVHAGRLELSSIKQPTSNADIIYWSIAEGSSFTGVENGSIIFNSTAMQDGENYVQIRIHNRPSYDDSEIKTQYNMIVIKNGLNVYDATSFEFGVYATKNGFPMVIHANLGDPNEDDDGIKPFAELSGIPEQNHHDMLYGNGFTINLNNFTTNTSYRFYAGARNVTIKRYSDSVDVSTYERTITGGGIQDANFSYVHFTNSDKSLWMDQKAYTCVFYKCLFTNARTCGVQLGKNDNTNGNATIIFEDCIFNNTGSCAVDYQVGSIRIRGKFDLYNFKSAADFDNSLYESALEKAYSSDEFKKYVDKTGTYVANIGIAAFQNLSTIPSDVLFYDPSTGTYISEDKVTGRGYKLVKGYTGVSFLKVHMVNLWLEEIYDSNGNLKPNAITKTSQVDYSILYRLGL